MDLEEDIDRWLDRGSKFFKTTARNSVVREALRARGLSQEELENGWNLFSELHGFGAEKTARPASHETAAAQALNDIEAWDAPAFGAAKTVLGKRFPVVAAYLFENLRASEGVAAAAGVERFLDRIALLRDGKAQAVPADAGKAAVELLATRKILEPAREAELRALIEIVSAGARSEEVVQPTGVNPRRAEVARAYIDWLDEWREVARVAISRRDYQISLGLAQRRLGGKQRGKRARKEMVVEGGAGEGLGWPRAARWSAGAKTIEMGLTHVSGPVPETHCNASAQMAETEPAAFPRAEAR
jgi:hypothetical protein